jgi:hypothetical protein
MAAGLGSGRPEMPVCGAVLSLTAAKGTRHIDLPTGPPVMFTVAVLHRLSNSQPDKHEGQSLAALKLTTQRLTACPLGVTCFPATALGGASGVTATSEAAGQEHSDA